MKDFSKGRDDSPIGPIFLLAVLLLSTPAAGAAQALGAQVGYESESEMAIVGVTAHIPIKVGSVPYTTISPQFEITVGGDYLVAAAGASIRFHPWYGGATSKVSPYFGAGLLVGYSEFFDETAGAGLAIAGLEFDAGGITPFTHFEFAFGDFEATAIVVGLQFSL